MHQEPEPLESPPTVRFDRDLLDLLLDASTDGVMDWDLDRQQIRYTDRWKLLLGYEPAQLLDTPTLWSELSHPDDLPRVRALLQDHLEGIWPFSHTWRMRHENGQWRFILCRAATLRDGDGRPSRLVAVFSDITDRVQAEERHRALTTALPDLLLRLGADGTLLDVKAPEGRPPAGLTWPEAGQTLAEWKPAAEWHDRVSSYVQGARRSSRPRLLEVTLAGIRPRRHAEIRVVPSGDDEAVCIVRDVTEQRQLQAQVNQGQKLESIGRLASGIANEISGPMQQIVASLARAQISDADEGGANALADALEGVARVSRIVNAMKEFAQAKAEKVPTDLNREIETALTVAAHAWTDLSHLERALDPTLPRVPCIAGEIGLAIIALIVAAGRAMGEAARTSDAKGLLAVATTVEGDLAELRVNHSAGAPLPDELAPARSVIEKHGGSLQIESTAGTTSFVVRLPLS